MVHWIHGLCLSLNRYYYFVMKWPDNHLSYEQKHNKWCILILWCRQPWPVRRYCNFVRGVTPLTRNSFSDRMRSTYRSRAWVSSVEDTTLSGSHRWYQIVNLRVLSFTLFFSCETSLLIMSSLNGLHPHVNLDLILFRVIWLGEASLSSVTEHPL